MAHALRYLIRFAAGILLFGAGAALAANAPPAGQPVRFTVFSARPIADLTFVPRPTAAPQKTVFYPTARSPRYEYRGAMPLRFIDSATNTVVAEATIPPEIREAFLLFVPMEIEHAEKLRYQISVLDDGPASRGPGGLAIINLSGLVLSGIVNTENVMLKSGLNPTLAVGRSAKIVLRTTSRNRSIQSYAEMFQLAKNQRALLILFPPFYKGSLEVQSRLLVDEPPVTSVK